MSRTIATEPVVYEAADRLHSEGRDVTIDAVRALVGGGSETTILRHLHRWRELPREVTPPPAMPASVQTCFGDLQRRLWTEIWSIAAREVETVRERAKAEVESSRQQAAEAFILSERHEAELDRLRGDSAEREAHVVQLEAQLLEASATRCRATALQAELDECRRALEQGATRERQVELLLATHKGEVSALENQLATIELHRTSERAQHLARITELERREATASESAARFAALEQELSACRAELSACRAELALRRSAAAAAMPDLIDP